MSADGLTFSDAEQIAILVATRDGNPDLSTDQLSEVAERFATWITNRRIDRALADLALNGRAIVKWSPEENDWLWTSVQPYRAPREEARA